MKQVLFFIFVFAEIAVFSQKKEIQIDRIDNYLNYLNTVELSAKDYVLSKFQEYDIVILSERYHTEETQYELINEIIRDDYFISNVGNICVEIGSSNMSDSLNSFLKQFSGHPNNGISKLLEFQRNISFYPIWNRDSYHIFLTHLMGLNQSLNKKRKINLYLCDRNFEWSTIQTKREWKNANNNDRDSILALNISGYFERIKDDPRKKMLVILNEAHSIPNSEWIDTWQKRAAQYLSEKYGRQKLASILINSVATDENDIDILLQDGYWDAAFSIARMNNVGFDFNNSPFGNDKFDYASGKNNSQFQYKDIFTGLVFYKPLEQHVLSVGVDNIVTPDFRKEFFRRIKIYYGNEYYKRLKTDSILIGWNKKEIYEYDNFGEMQKAIQRLKDDYIRFKE